MLLFVCLFSIFIYLHYLWQQPNDWLYANNRIRVDSRRRPYSNIRHDDPSRKSPSRTLHPNFVPVDRPSGVWIDSSCCRHCSCGGLLANVLRQWDDCSKRFAVAAWAFPVRIRTGGNRRRGHCPKWPTKSSAIDGLGPISVIVIQHHQDDGGE